MNRSNFFYLLTAFLACLFLAFTAAANEKAVATLPVQPGGWNGADAAYNRALPDGGRLWIFGDTLIGPVENGRRAAGGEMVRNSIGVENAQGEFEYYTGAGEQCVFANTRQGEWYWPGDFVLVDGKAYFFLRRMIATDPSDVFGFKVTGVDVVYVRNPQDHPRKWKKRFFPFPSNGLIMGVAASVQDGFIYSFASNPKNGHSLYIARIDLEDFRVGEPKPRYFDSQVESWVGGLPAEPTLASGAPEASLAFNDASRRWRLIHSASGFSPDIVMRESASLTSGWSVPKKLFSCPEIWQSKQFFCYAGKEVHGTANLTVTYSVNSLVFDDLEANAGIYIPRLVVVGKTEK